MFMHLALDNFIKKKNLHPTFTFYKCMHSLRTEPMSLPLITPCCLCWVTRMQEQYHHYMIISDNRMQYLTIRIPDRRVISHIRLCIFHTWPLGIFSEPQDGPGFVSFWTSAPLVYWTSCIFCTGRQYLPDKRWREQKAKSRNIVDHPVLENRHVDFSITVYAS